jgi:tetratricopeptide (TPR) repeat protein
MGQRVQTVKLPEDELLALAAVARQSAEQGRLDDARVLLEGLIAIEPQIAFLRTSLGCVYLKMDRADEALAEFDAALALDEADVAAHAYAGELRLERDDNGMALAHLEAAIALDPEGRNAFANRARTLRLRAAPTGQGG